MHCKGCHMVVRKGTHMILTAMVYSAVIVVMMKNVHKIADTIYQGQAKLGQHVERFNLFFVGNIGIKDVDIFTEITICT